MASPEEKAIYDHYWYHENHNPFDGGTIDAYEYQIAYDEETRNEEFKQEIFGS